MQPDWEVEHHPLKHNISKDIMCLIVNNDLLTLAEQKMTETVLFEKPHDSSHSHFYKTSRFFGGKQKTVPLKRREQEMSASPADCTCLSTNQQPTH